VAHREGLVLVAMGVVATCSTGPADLLKTLLPLAWYYQAIQQRFFITSPLDDNPFTSTNYPAGFPLAEVADTASGLWMKVGLTKRVSLPLTRPI
jgi:hypothetical protein